MQPVNSTAEILASKVLNQGISTNWVQWAIDMLSAGFDSEHLRILAGELPPYNQFYLKDLTDKVLRELNLDYSNEEQAIKDYVIYLVDKGSGEGADTYNILRTLKNLQMDYDFDFISYNFCNLYWAKEDLLESDVQYYWEGADRSNIDKIIKDYFISYKANCNDQR